MTVDPIAINFGARDPRRNLWAAVLEQAEQDIFLVPPVSHYKEALKARKEAIALLTSETGEWARHRALICGLIDCDPDVVRERILQRMALTPPPEIPYRAPKKNWKSQPTLTPEERSERRKFLWLMQYLERTAADAVDDLAA